MKKYTNRWPWIGGLLGALGGFLYWHEIGCLTGHCPIQSHWQTMIFWGAMTGFLLGDLLHQLAGKRMNNYGDADKRNL
ncbi:hypothetical protein [Spirosoma sp.]|uniref:hypothetical protein n=1 Tax=Spirosoma sp. TaxID=1899569 RepID=UPI002606BF3D|nr:hypothetical protein [Spirosoma sp.]MCX6216779.1 hypothetical protein [Spirosoma sp.]